LHAQPDANHVGRSVLVMLAALAAGMSGCASAPVIPRSCAAGLQGSFLQLAEAQLGHGEREWAAAMGVLRATGTETMVLQFTGDGTGAYDDRNQTGSAGPVRAVLAAAESAGVKVYLGLHADPRWPSDEAVLRLPPPLEDRAVAQALGQLCRQSPACAGWYLPNEIDDETWRDPRRTRALHAHLVRAAATVRALAPGRAVLVAPFFTGRLDPRAHARWWGELMAGHPFDVLALQDGVGTGRVTPERAAEYLRALAPVAAAAGVRLWSVVELFEQLHGTPHDLQPFAARPAAFATVRRSLQAERPLVEQAIGFAVLDYMNPHQSRRARRLYDGYVDWCRQASPPSSASSAARPEPAVSTAATKTLKKGT
jgi:hypothetical protein